jgi:isoquinoline 1-oxidoreductase
MELTTTVNGTVCEFTDGQGSLLAFLRHRLGLKGAKPGCGEGECGACTVLVDGEPVLACQTELAEVAGRSVTTAEGLSTDGALHPMQQALMEEMASQCGYCTPGMAVRGAALLSRDLNPDDEHIAAALGPNLCRCGCYSRIVQAVKRASVLLRAGSSQSGHQGPPEEAVLFARPHRPWDLCEPGEREWPGLLGDGLFVVWPPQMPPESWTTGGGAWLHVAPSGRVTAFSGKVDVGQDNQTAFRLLVAEEMAADLEGVRVVQGDTDVCPFDMGTFGSRSMPDAGEALRRAAAGTRQLLVGLAAQRLEIDASRLSTPGGSVVEGPGGDKVAYGDLVEGLRRAEVLTREPALTLPEARRFVGRPGHTSPRLDAVTGRRRFVSDLELPGMLYGAVLRPPVRGAKLRAVDPAAAERLPGVTVVRDGDFVGVLAEGSPVAARLVLALVEAEWDVPARVGEGPVSYLRSHPTAGTGWEQAVDDSTGEVDVALAAGHVRVDATYTTAWIAHVPLETRAAVACWDGGRLTAWTGTQVPFGVRRYLAEALGLDEVDVRVIVPPTGGGFGGKHGGDVALEAARLARAADRPVKVHWSRAEEFKWGYLRPMAVIDVRAALDAAGSLSAWDFLDINAGPAALGLPYRVADRRLRYQPAVSPLAQGSYRALGANANNFARECHIDELAYESAVDPVAFRLSHLDDERLVTVLRAAADRFGWAEPKAVAAGARTGSGVAVGLEKGGRVASCAEVLVHPSGSVQVARVVTAYDCGAIVNRDTVANQVEGATVMALGAALFEEIPWEDGRLGELSLARYRLPRFGDVPLIDVVLVDRPDLPSEGAGESPMIAVAPAVANAIFAATGRRLRSLPLAPTGRLPGPGPEKAEG